MKLMQRHFAIMLSAVTLLASLGCEQAPPPQFHANMVKVVSNETNQAYQQEIANLPAGEEVEIQVWHEHATGGKGALFVESDAAKELKWSDKGRFKIKLEPDEVRELNITVPSSAFGG